MPRPLRLLVCRYCVALLVCAMRVVQCWLRVLALLVQRCGMYREGCLVVQGQLAFTRGPRRILLEMSGRRVSLRLGVLGRGVQLTWRGIGLQLAYAALTACLVENPATPICSRRPALCAVKWINTWKPCSTFHRGATLRLRSAALWSRVTRSLSKLSPAKKMGRGQMAVPGPPLHPSPRVVVMEPLRGLLRLPVV